MAHIARDAPGALPNTAPTGDHFAASNSAGVTASHIATNTKRRSNDGNESDTRSLRLSTAEQSRTGTRSTNEQRRRNASHRCPAKQPNLECGKQFIRPARNPGTKAERSETTAAARHPIHVPVPRLSTDRRKHWTYWTYWTDWTRTQPTTLSPNSKQIKHLSKHWKP